MSIKKVISFIVFIFSFFLLVTPVYADSYSDLKEERTTLKQELKELEESSTENSASVGITVYKEDLSETSMMQDYIESPATVTVQDDGTYLASLTILKPDYWQSFQVNGTDVVLQSNDGESAVVTFSITDLTANQECQIHIVVPAINYDNTYTTYLQFEQNDAVNLLSESDKEQRTSEIEERLEEIDDILASTTSSSDSKASTKKNNSGIFSPVNVALVVVIILLLSGYAYFMIPRKDRK